MSLNFENVLVEFLKNVPEIRPNYNQYLKQLKDELPRLQPVPYTVFDDVITPYLIEQLSLKEVDKDVLKRIFNLLEYMANSLDEQVKGVLLVNILERVGFDVEILKKAYHYMGSKTVEIFQKLETFNVLSEFLKCIPELKLNYDQYLKQWDNEFPGLHNIFGDILNPYLIEQLSLKQLDEDLLKRIFIFLEDMANSPDGGIQNVLYVTILERLGDDTEILKKAYHYMGPKTIKMSQEIEKYWGRDFNIFSS